MRQRLDIADVEERTKIRAKYLRALENEEWGLLPGPTFVRTFLRTYAEAVGVDPHVLVEEYRSTQEDAEDPAEVQPTPLPPRRPRRPRLPSPDSHRRPRPPGPPAPLVLLGGAIVAVLVLFLVLGLLGDDSSDSGNKQASKTTPGSTTPKGSAKRRAKPKPKPKPAPPKGVTLKIAPTVPTYVCLDTGEGSDHVFEGILSEPRTFKNANQLRANLGKRSVKLTANGKNVPVQPNAAPLGLQVTKTATKEITSGPRPCG